MMTIEFSETLPAIVLGYGESLSEKNAVCLGDKATTYGVLASKIKSCVSSLLALGLEKGECVLLSAVASADYIASFLAVKYLGLVAVPLNKGAVEAEVEDIADRTNAKLFLSDNSRYKLSIRKSMREFCSADSSLFDSHLPPENVESDAISELLFTSGTTGKPKGAMLSQSQIRASIHNTSTGMDMTSDDTILIPLPLNHSFGLRVLRSALYNGETIVLQNGFSFPKEMKMNIERWKCTALVAVTAGFERIREQVGQGYVDLYKSLHYIEFGAGAVPAGLRKKLIEDLPNLRLYNTWGSTETGGGLFIEFSKHQDKLESAGAPINDIKAFVLDDKGEVLPTGEYGRLAISSSAVMSGYYKDSELTDAFLHGDVLYTNDLAKMDEDGFVYLKGRIDDVISVGGEKVAPADIEKIVSGLDSISACACIGVDDDKLGQVPVLFVVGDASDRDIEERIRKEGNGYMVPKEIVRIAELPRNYMGKLDRKALRDMYEKRGVEKAEPATDIADRVLSLITSRRSIRNFAEKCVVKALIDRILLAGRMAPSGHNMQTWRFTVIQKAENIEELKNTAKAVSQKKKTPYYGWNNPKVLIVVSNDRRNFDAAQDSSAAIENMLLMAHAQGLGACWLNALFFTSDEPEIRNLLDKYSIPKAHIVYGVVGLGWPVQEAKTPAKKENCIYYYD